MRWSTIILAALLVFDVWYRAHTFAPAIPSVAIQSLWFRTTSASEPLDCDEAAYAYIGHRMLHGDVMYRDLTENKPPLGYWLYALAVAMGGYNELAIRLLPIPAVLLTIVLVWWIGSRLAGPVAACVSAGIYVLLSTDPYLFGNGSNMEHFMNLFSVASLALMIYGWSSSRRWPLVAAGALLGAASLVKQIAILPAVVYAIALMLRAGADPDPGAEVLKRRLGDVLALAMGLVVAVGLAGLVLLVQGAGWAAYEDIFQYGRALATDTLPESGAPSGLVRWLTGNADPSGRLPWPFGSTNYLVWWGTGSWPLWLVAVPSLAYLMIGRGTSAPRRLVSAWTIAGGMQVLLPGLYWQHYYLLPAPGIALVVAITLADCVGVSFARLAGSSRRMSASGSWIARLSALALVLAVAATSVIQVRAYLLVPPEELTVRYKGGGQWVALRALGRELDRRKTVWTDPRLYVWGWQSPLHFYGRLDGVTRHFFVDNLLRDQAERNHLLIKPRIAEIMRTLRDRPPLLIFAGYAPFPALRDFLLDRYLPSSLVPARNGMGLWIERTHFGAFETFRTVNPAARSGDRSQGAQLASEGKLVASPKLPHDCVPALGQCISSRSGSHGETSVRVRDEGKQSLGNPLWWITRFDQQAGATGLDGVADTSGPDSDHGHTRSHGFQDDVAEGLGEAGEREDVASGIVIGQVFSRAIASELGDGTDSLFQFPSRRAVSHEQDSHIGPR
jgi:4-amino-4-deoxy-L-arabinose transferase-like glycosyltransferase